MSKFLHYYKKHFGVCFAITIFVFLILLWILNPLNIKTWFFGVGKTPSDILAYIGLISVAIVVVANLYIMNNRTLVTEKSQLDKRFKDAVELLISDNTSACLSGIFALDQIAVDAANDIAQKGYVGIVHNILCAYIRDNTDSLPSNDNLTKPATTKKPTIIIQAIIDALFKNENNIYADMHSDLSKCVFKSIDFSGSNVSHVDFSYSYFLDVNFDDSNLYHVSFENGLIEKALCRNAMLSTVSFSESRFFKIDFSKTRLLFTNFTKARIQNIKLIEASLFTVKFTEASLWDVNASKVNSFEADFGNSNLHEANFSEGKMEKTNYNKAVLEGTDFRDCVFIDLPNFKGTKLEHHPVDRILQNSKYLTRA